MYRFFLPLIIFIIFSVKELQSQSTFSDLQSLKYNWEMYELENGLRVLLQDDPKAETVSIELWTNTGARDEQVGELGMAHFFEHATPYGLSSKDEKRRRLLGNLKGSNAQVTMDFTTYYLEMHDSLSHLAIEYFADRFKEDPNTYIIDRRTDYHKENVLNEINRNSRSPSFGVSARTMRYKHIFGAHHPYGHGAYGYIQDNQRISTDDLRRWYRANFRPEYATLFVIGKFDQEKISSVIEQQFSSIQGGARYDHFPDYNTESKSASIEIRTNVEDYFQSVSWKTPSWSHKDTPSLILLSYILEKRLEEKAEADSNIIAAGSLRLTNFYHIAGEFGIYASFPKIKTEQEAKSLLIDSIQDLLVNGVTEIEMDQAKIDIYESIKRNMGKLGFFSSRTRWLGTSLFFTGNPDAYFERLEHILSLDAKIVNEVARKTLSNPGVELLLIPKND